MQFIVTDAIIMVNDDYKTNVQSSVVELCNQSLVISFSAGILIKYTLVQGPYMDNQFFFSYYLVAAGEKIAMCIEGCKACYFFRV